MTDAAPPAAAEPSRAPRAISAALRAVEAGGDPREAARSLGMTEAAFGKLRKSEARKRKARLVGQVPLVFRDLAPDAEKALHEDISAVLATGEGESLWVGVDEGAALERLSAARDAAGRIVGYGEHVRFDLHDYFDFPNGAEEEADVEGLALSDGYLWVVGSHSLKRKKPNPDQDPEDALKRLTTVEREANRFLVGRIPLVAGDRPGVLALAKKAPAIDGGRRPRRSGAVKMGKTGSALSRKLKRDVHLGPFLSVPSKDNGLDVEGMAVSDGRVLLGLRGPVLRGWAVILEIAVKATRKGRLKLTPFDDGAVFRKHFLDLDGLGVRSLLIDGSDLLILAGPTLDLDGPVRLYRWRGALGAHESAVVPRDEVERALDLPFGEGDDHAEGATLIRLAPDARPILMVAYDSPAHARVLPGGGALADLFEAPAG